jgi:hypothetical protein
MGTDDIDAISGPDYKQRSLRNAGDWNYES